MKTEPHDPILDACLEELLGGKAPPDLSDSIMESWQRMDNIVDPRETDSLPATAAVDDSLLPVLDSATKTAVESANSSDWDQELSLAKREQTSSLKRSWSRVAVIASMLTIGACISLIAIKVMWPPGLDQTDTPIANSTKKPPSQDANKSTIPEDQTSPQDHNSEHAVLAANRDPANTSEDSKNSRSGKITGPGKPTTDPPSQITASNPSRFEPADNQAIIKFVNQQLSDSWKAASLSPSARATDAEWCRRVYLRLLGRIPTKQELDSFVKARPSTNRRTALVDQLLNDGKYGEEYVQHWTTIWTNLLIGRRGGIGKGDLANREGLQQYLRHGFQENKPYDQMAYELISATGSNTPGTENYNGAVNFILASMNNQATLATARTSRIFLGKQLQCVQCHKHPSNDWAQQNFWEMNAFFRQAQVLKTKQTNVHLLVNRDFVGKQGDPNDAEIYFDEPDGSMSVAYPRFLGGKSLDHNGQVGKFDRRTELARLVRQSDDLSRALVNRTWAHFLGYGFTRPVDDMGHHNAVSHPELLERLAKQFKAHHYNMKDLFRWIVVSDAFALSSRFSLARHVAVEGEDLLANNMDTPELGEVAYFSRYYMRPMQPEEVYQSLLVVAGKNQPTGSPLEIEQARRDWLGQFARKMDTDEGDESNLFSGNIHQSLVMMNGPLMKQATSANARSVLAKVMESKMETLQKVEHLFLAAVARKPTKRELKLVQQMLDQSTPDQMLQDIWWALLNSNEFILDH